MQMLTFLSGIKNYILIGAEPGAWLPVAARFSVELHQGQTQLKGRLHMAPCACWMRNAAYKGRVGPHTYACERVHDAHASSFSNAPGICSDCERVLLPLTAQTPPGGCQCWMWRRPRCGCCKITMGNQMPRGLAARARHLPAKP